MKKRALISVYCKDGILDLASYLGGAGWEILSTGGTAKHLTDNKIPVIEVSSVTGFPECLDGRVKTLHPAIHAGLLARRSLPSHMDTLKELNLKTIDLVCVNLYPFFEKVQAGLSQDETIEFIDIGGPSMLRSAAKNFQDVIVLTDPADYGEVINCMKAGAVPEDLRKRLAGKVFGLTSVYDAAIARYLLEPDKDGAGYPAYWPLSLKKAADAAQGSRQGIPSNLRYGENSHQSSALYFHADRPGALSGMEQLHGKELGYNNIRDLDLAWKAACAFGLPADGTAPLGEDEVKRFVPGGMNIAGEKKICCVAVKHNTPCGIALGSVLIDAFEKTYACDPMSIFGGIVACNTTMDALTAARLGEIILDVIVAPDYDSEALKILTKRKNIRIIKALSAPKDTKEYTAVDGGILVQDTDRRLMEKWEVVTRAVVAAEDIGDLIFGMRAVAFVKSNAIMIVKDLAAAGIGGGQVNRIWPAVQSLERSATVIKDAASSHGSWADGRSARVLASDAFIPFPDVIEAAAAFGIKAIIQPGGSINDKASIEACDRLGLAMVFTGLRHFKH